MSGELRLSHLVGVGLPSLVFAATCAADDGSGGASASSDGGSNSSHGSASASTGSGAASTGGVSSDTTTTALANTSTTSSGGASSTTSTTAPTTTGSAGAPPTPVDSSSTTAGAGCQGETVTAPVPLTPDDTGWVGCETNSAGVSGSFFGYTDTGGSTVRAAFSEGSACVSGTVAQVMDGDYAWTYGAGLGFSLNDEAVWDAAGVGVSGVTFNLSTLPDTPVRMIFTTAAGDHCTVLEAAGAHTVAFADTTLECWETSGATPVAAEMLYIRWQVVTDETAAYPYDFCITELAVTP